MYTVNIVEEAVHIAKEQLAAHATATKAVVYSADAEYVETATYASGGHAHDNSPNVGR